MTGADQSLPDQSVPDRNRAVANAGVADPAADRQSRIRRLLSAAKPAASTDKAEFPTAWARSLGVRVLRDVVQGGGLGALVRRLVDLDVHGSEDLAQFDGPVLLVANHSSHLDTAVLLTTLPPDRRRRTAVAAAADYFFDVWWRAAGSAILFSTFPIERRGGSASTVPAELVDAGWSILVYPEGTRSADGYMGRFRLGAAWLAIEHQLPVVPVGLRGTYAAMPRGATWPVRGRPRISVRYGAPIVPKPDDTIRTLAPRITAAVRDLVAEDESTWWQVRRGTAPSTPVPTASWRRIWARTAPSTLGGVTARPRIWRR